MDTDCTAIKDIRPGQRNIKATFIVLEVGDVLKTKKNCEIWNFKVADQTGCINIGIWADIAQDIAPGDIIKITKGYALVWRRCLTLYSGKEGELYKMGEFCMVFNEQMNMSEPNRFKRPPTEFAGEGVEEQEKET